MTDHERDALHQKEVASFKEIIASQEGVIAQLTQHNRVLQLKVDALVRRLFGKSSEKNARHLVVVANPFLSTFRRHESRSIP